jgi:DNA-binding SARP family transcriptional activator/Tfp pilus assembly protein PilF
VDTHLVFGILGPLEVRAGGTLVHIGGPRQRALLALLLCHANRVVSRDQLIDELLSDQPAESAERMLRVQVSRLRQALSGCDGQARVLTRSPGYQLRVEDGELDLQVFEQRVAAGRYELSHGDAGQAAVLLGEAQRLWRGRPLADLEFEPFARFEIQRLEALRLSVVEDRIEADLALGRHAALCPELEQLVAEHPLRERLRGQLMLALYRSGRQAEALGAYRAGRALLVAELAVEPGPVLRGLHEQVLAADPGLDLPAPARAAALAGQPVPAVIPRELPADVGSFTGRAVELAELDLLLRGADEQEAGAVVISAVAGTAGVGKTALAVRWAHRVAREFPDGQLYVNLRGYDPDQPIPATEALAGFLRALGIPGIPLEEAERAARFRSVTAGKRLLVVLDNAATEQQVRPLLPGTPSVLVLVTSRDSLAGLVARDGARRLDLDLLSLSEAVALLTTLIGDRAEEDPAAIETLAGQCARLPLALRVAAELAASRPGTQLAELVAELADQAKRLELLGAGADPRTAVASVFSWSYQHLPADGARLFRLLGLHPAQDWEQYAAAALAGTSLAQAGQLLAVLARAHVIQPAGPGRYQMHDLLRSYAASLAARDDSDQVRRAALTRLFDFYLVTCAAAMDVLNPATHDRRPASSAVGTPVPEFGDQSAAGAWLDAELPALAAVASHTAGHGWPGHTIRLAAVLERYLDLGRGPEGLAIHSHALSAARVSDNRVAEAAALANLGDMFGRHGRYQQAVEYSEQALALARDADDRRMQAFALAALGMSYDGQSRYRQAADCARQELALHRESGNQIAEAFALGRVGLENARQGRYRQAARILRQVLALTRQTGDRTRDGSPLAQLGAIYCRLGRFQRAAALLQRSLTLARQNGDRFNEGWALTWLGDLSHRQGDHDQATGYYRQALELLRQIGDSLGEADALNGTGQTLLATGQPSQAYACHTAALTLTRQNGNRHQQARSLTRLGDVCHQQGHLDHAIGLHQQALALFQDIGDRGGEADALNGAGETLLASGQPGQAHDRHTTALALARRTGDRYEQARAHHGIAEACHAAGDSGQARQHWQHSADICASLGIPDATRVRTSLPGSRQGQVTTTVPGSSTKHTTTAMNPPADASPGRPE